MILSSEALFLAPRSTSYPSDARFTGQVSRVPISHEARISQNEAATNFLPFSRLKVSIRRLAEISGPTHLAVSKKWR